MSARIHAIALALSVCAGCADRLPAKPELTAVDPSAAHVAADLLVHLQGKNLVPRRQFDFATGRSADVGAYSAHLVAPTGAEIPLAQVALVSQTEATAVVPVAGVTEATTYDVVLVDPWGGTSKLAGGFRALAACENADGTGPRVGAPCDGPDTDDCQEGTWYCNGTQPACSDATSDDLDVCNGLDDDCNPNTPDGSGETAKYLQPCDGQQDTDLCPEGIWRCDGTSGWSCTDNTTDGCAPNFQVGWFLKPGKSVTDVNPYQTISHGLLDTPKALVLWTGYDSVASYYKPGYQLSIGVTDASLSSAAVGIVSLNGASPTLAAREMAASAISVLGYQDPAYVVRAQAVVTAWGPDSFTLRWDINQDVFPTLVYYLAISGEPVQSKLVSWQTPSTAGALPIGSVGFQPDLVFHLHAGNAITYTPEISTDSALGFAAMTSASEWATSIASLEGWSTASKSFRAHRPGASVYIPMWSPGTGSFYIGKEASRAAMTSTGFTLDFSTVNPTASLMSSLALSGLSTWAACVSKATATGPQEVRGIPFQPKAVLLVGTHEISAPAISSLDAIYSFGAFDAATQAVVALRDTSGQKPSVVESTSRVTNAPYPAAYLKPRPGGGAGAGLAWASASAFLADGFRLQWDQNDVDADQICYVAFGP